MGGAALCNELCESCNMTHSYVWHDSWTRAHSYVWHDAFIRGPWLIHMCDMTHAHVFNDSSTCVTRRIPMGWLRSVGSLKLQVSFAKEPYKRDDILQKRPVILRSLLIVATPYVENDTFVCVTWRIHTWDMTHSYVWRDACTRHMYIVWVMPHIRISHFTNAKASHHTCKSLYDWVVEYVWDWLIHMCDMTHSYVGLDTFMCGP